MMGFQASLVNDKDIEAAIAFYDHHAPHGLIYPRDLEWIRSASGKELFLFGAWQDDELVGVVWAACKPNFIHFAVKGGNLVLVKGEPYAESGGMLVRKKFHGAGVDQLLTATCHAFWFVWLGREESHLRARVSGKKGSTGVPLFWELVGEQLTDIPYRELLESPFGTLEQVIAGKWPSGSIPLAELPARVLEEALGKPAPELAPYERRLMRWGFEPTELYAPTSLNRFLQCTKQSIRAPESFAKRAGITYDAGSRSSIVTAAPTANG